jgi:hypothetical protein
MDREPSWISLTAGSTLCALAAILLVVLTAQVAKLHNVPELQSHYIGADMPLSLRLMR